jgi:hypothetical protein
MSNTNYNYNYNSYSNLPPLHNTLRTVVPLPRRPEEIAENFHAFNLRGSVYTEKEFKNKQQQKLGQLRSSLLKNLNTLFFKSLPLYMDNPGTTNFQFVREITPLVYGMKNKRTYDLVIAKLTSPSAWARLPSSPDIDALINDIMEEIKTPIYTTTGGGRRTKRRRQTRKQKHRR